MYPFIAIEGSDACGKTTQLNLLKEKFSDRITFTKEPGSPYIDTCKAIREVLLNVDNEMSPVTEAMLYAADRHEHLLSVKEWLEKRPVVSDRSIFSSLAYQPSYRQITVEDVADINKRNMDLLMPELVIFLELSSEERERRLENRNEQLDRLELNSKEFFEEINKNYPEAFAKYAEEVVIIDASQDVETIHETIVKILKERNVL